MATKKEKVYAGLFLVGGVALLVAVVAYIQQLGQAEQTPFVVHFPPRSSVAGLSIGSKVKFKGVGIGKVQGIDLHAEGHALAHILIDGDKVQHLDAGVRAVLNFEGITGAKSIDLKQIDRGTAKGQERAAELFQESGLLAEEGAFSALMEDGPEVLTDVHGVVGRVGLLVARADRFIARSEERLDAFLISLDVLAAEGGPRLIALLERTDRTLARAEQRLLAEGGTLDTIEGSFDRHLERLVDEVALTASDVALNADLVAQEVTTAIADTKDPTVETLDAARVTLADIRRLIADLRDVVDANRTAFGELVTELRDASDSIDKTMTEIRRDPNALIFGREDEGSRP